jgi:acetyl esterase/lipase
MTAPPNPKLARLIEVLWERALGPDDPVDKRRADFEAVAASMPLPEDVDCHWARLDNLRAEWLRPAHPVGVRTILYLHGGGYVIGSCNTIRPLAAQLATAASARVLTVDYRLAPEHPFPAAVEDAVVAYRWLLDEGYDPGSLAIGGDSAGGGLTVATLVAARDIGLPLPAAAVCISPWVDLTLSAPSIDANAKNDPQVQRSGLARMAGWYLAGQDPTMPLASPLFADLSGLPPMLIHAGSVEALVDDARGLAQAASGAGVDVTLECWEDMIHVWHAFAPGLPEGTAGIKRVGAWLTSEWSRKAA